MAGVADNADKIAAEQKNLNLVIDLLPAIGPCGPSESKTGIYASAFPEQVGILITLRRLECHCLT
jgi:hypothetical protein